MKLRIVLIGVAAAGAIGGAGFGLYRVGVEHGMTRMAATSARAAGTAVRGATEGEAATRRLMQLGMKAGDVDPANGRKILYFHDPMVPNAKFDAPGKSPFMDMLLVPVYEGAAEGGGNQGVAISPRIQQSIGIRTVEVREGESSQQVSVEGDVAYDERDEVVIQARATGYVERLYVRATLDRVHKGQALVDLYVPDWVAAQEEFLALRRTQAADIASLRDAARERMRQVGMTDRQIRLIEATGRTHPIITLRAPIDGVVDELAAREGMTVTVGKTLFRINGLRTVWVDGEVPESQAALLRPGAKVRVQSPAVPDMTFDGRVQAILPRVNPATRTIEARMELANRSGRLAPGMFVTMNFVSLQAQKALLVPTSAVIQTGRRALVMLADGDGTFRPVAVETGIESGGQIEIKRGLRAGQQVVVSSQFLIDSEASLEGVEARLGGPRPPASGTAGASGAATRHRGEARVEAIENGMATLSHRPIPSMHWGAMTMDFKLPPGGPPPGVTAGSRVRFEFIIGADGLPQLTSIVPEAAARARQAAVPVPATGNRP